MRCRPHAARTSLNPDASIIRTAMTSAGSGATIVGAAGTAGVGVDDGRIDTVEELIVPPAKVCNCPSRATPTNGNETGPARPRKPPDPGSYSLSTDGMQLAGPNDATDWTLWARLSPGLPRCHGRTVPPSGHDTLKWPTPSTTEANLG